ncbi:MAG: hypothetical protein KC964_28165, partial [Candidatus Omnitrophica bacterium]|nr:hypothetical protein [Candidatus Omnitrophota bacterium]
VSDSADRALSGVPGQGRLSDPLTGGGGLCPDFCWFVCEKERSGAACAVAAFAVRGGLMSVFPIQILHAD